ncbi:MAG TPA: hypothetical protein V6C65_04065 [Allocoleopsis sp.]
MVEVICKLSGLKFEAPTKRSQVHPEIAGWKQYANKNGWYMRCLEAIEYGKSKGFQAIEEFEAVLNRAEHNKPLEEKESPVTPEGAISIGEALAIALIRVNNSPDFAGNIWHKGDRLYIKTTKGAECGYCCRVKTDGEPDRFGFVLKQHRDEIRELLGDVFGKELTPAFVFREDPERAALVARYGEFEVADAEADVARENWDI